jgi:hypothetical protein
MLTTIEYRSIERCLSDNDQRKTACLLTLGIWTFNILLPIVMEYFVEHQNLQHGDYHENYGNWHPMNIHNNQGNWHPISMKVMVTDIQWILMITMVTDIQCILINSQNA